MNRWQNCDPRSVTTILAGFFMFLHHAHVQYDLSGTHDENVLYDT